MTAYGINPPFDGLSRGMGQVGYALLTRAPVVILEEQALPDVTPRLACVKPVASVHPEPGSNSPLYNIFILSLSRRKGKIVSVQNASENHPVSPSEIDRFRSTQNSFIHDPYIIYRWKRSLLLVLLLLCLL